MTTTVKQAKTSRAGWFLQCTNPDGTPMACGFQIRNHDRAELLRFALEHDRASHGLALAENDLFPYLREVTW